MNKHEQISQLLELSTEELLVRIGEDIRGKGASPSSKGQLVMLAKDWLTKKSKEIQEQVCTSDKVRTIANTDKTQGDVVMLISAIADLIASLKIGISPITVAVLIFREGLIQYCKTYWN